MVGKVGLMLGGGGAKGIYQVGVIKALYEWGLMADVEAIAGTSIGAINTFLIATTNDIYRMKYLWTLLDSDYVYSNSREDKKGIFDTRMIVQILSEKVSLEPLRDSKRRFFVTTCRLKQNKSHQPNILAGIDFKNMEKAVFELNTYKNPIAAVTASSSMPIVFGVVDIEGEYYVDGGVLDNYSLDPLLEAGCETIYGIPLDDNLKIKKYMDQPLLYINFLIPKIFKNNLIGMMFEATAFQLKYKQQLYQLGYYAAQLLLTRLFKQGVVVQDGEKHRFVKQVEGFESYGLSASDLAIIEKMGADHSLGEYE
jgi:NTE family protein